MTVQREDVLAARDRVSSMIDRTPVLQSDALDRHVGTAVFLKCESFQKTGSFKARGACNAVACLSSDERSRGVYTHSSGNHAQALAFAAHLHRIPCHVVMPRSAVQAKVAATRAYGANIVFCDDSDAARRAAADQLGEETGAVFVHPHDDPNVIAGQGTACLELLDEAGPLDVILAPIGGGGLLSGTILAAQGDEPCPRIIGCEPAGADDASRSLATGERIVEFTPRTIADGLRTPLGDIPFTIIRSSVDRIATVSEDDILAALWFAWERIKIVIEPSSAVALAPLLNGSVDVKGQRVGVIVSGGNVDLTAVFTLLEGTV
ncbi:MAG TPA: threonine/serine dehydratase [Candidatus Acetothermia bacterium]|nr:threonine/serine dehydratase [Candidatus Acetothermia bacterium]